MRFPPLLLGENVAILHSNDPVPSGIPESRLWGNKNTSRLELIPIFYTNWYKPFLQSGTVKLLASICVIFCLLLGQTDYRFSCFFFCLMNPQSRRKRLMNNFCAWGEMACVTDRVSEVGRDPEGSSTSTPCSLQDFLKLLWVWSRRSLYSDRLGAMTTPLRSRFQWPATSSGPFLLRV